jgi:Flp pilus assembly protein TadG
MKRLSKFLANTTGNVGIMFGLLSIPLLLAAGVAIDFGRAHSTRAILQAAADAAAFAGGTSPATLNDAQVQKLVEDFLKRNNAEYALDVIDSMEKRVDPRSGKFQVLIDGRINTSLMRLAGINEMEVGATSEVSMGFKTLEVVMVLDNTGSMSGSKIENLKTSATGLVDILEDEKPNFTEIKIGLVPFVNYVNVGTENKTAPWLDMASIPAAQRANWKGCVASRATPNDLEADAGLSAPYPAVIDFMQWDSGRNRYNTHQICPAPILPLTTDFDQVRTRISEMNANGWTFIPAGVLWGWNALSPAEPFTEGREQDELERMRGKKVMIVMTDGFNTVKPMDPPSRHETSNSIPGDALTSSLCTNAKRDGIEIYSIAFMLNDPPTKQMLTRCASSPTKYFSADDPAQLIKVFSDIARDLAATRLTQ